MEIILGYGLAALMVVFGWKFLIGSLQLAESWFHYFLRSGPPR